MIVEKLTGGAVIILIMLLLVVIGLLLNKPLRQQLLIKFRGRTDEIMNEDASTPEGAKERYNVAIREKEVFYNKASNLYSEICGKVDASEKELHNCQKDLMKINKEIKKCIKDNNEDDAMQYAIKKEVIDSKIDVLKNTIDELKEAREHQKEVRDQAAEDLNALKAEKERVIYELEANSQIIDIHASMDENNVTNETNRQLERVRDGARKTKERARGSRIAYDSSAQAMDRRLEQSARESSARETIEKMKREMGK